MSWRIYLLLFVLGFGIVFSVALLQSSPGYMDADYYYAGGIQLVRKMGLQEDFIWNYLEDPPMIPHPSHGYWMPLASFVAWAGMIISGIRNFDGARLLFLVMAGFVPPLTAWLAYTLNGKRGGAILAGLCAVFPAFYLPYLATTDTFAIYMILGTMWLQVGGRQYRYLRKSEGRKIAVMTILMGLIAGLMHLARTDGILWLAIGLIFLVYESYLDRAVDQNLSRGSFLWRVFFLMIGYLLVVSPWLYRNFYAFGTLLAPGGSKSLWFIEYNDLYIYPAAMVTALRWWQSGLGNIFGVRLWALGQNLQTALAVQGQLFLAPLMIIGLSKLRKDLRVWSGVVAWILTLVVMTLMFPFAGSRGGFFHSGAALQPLFWAAAPQGLDILVDWGAVRRGWQVEQARRFFGVGLVLFSVLLSAFIVKQRVIGEDFREPIWNKSFEHYKELDEKLGRKNPKDEDYILVNNPPGYWVATGRPAVVIPAAGTEILRSVAGRYGAQYLLLEPNHPDQLTDLYNHPRGYPGLDFIQTIDGTHVFLVLPQD